MKLILAAVAALALSGPAFAQAGHEMSKMPGMKGDENAQDPGGGQSSPTIVCFRQ